MARIDGISLEFMVPLAILSGISLPLFRSYRIIKIIITTLVGIVWGTAGLFWNAYLYGKERALPVAAGQLIEASLKLHFLITAAGLQVVICG